MSVPNSKGPRWAAPDGRARRQAYSAVVRPYPALELWRAAHARGVRLHGTDPLERAACHEANAAEYDALANRAASLGEAGDFVRAVLPASESDPAALLISFLVGVGSLVGRHVYYPVERDRHYCNLFALIAGATGHARKGSSWGWVRSVLQLAEPRFVVENLKSGLSSGEGLIHHVRDAGTALPPSAGRSGNVTEADPGVVDKRLLVHESEFARVIALLEKEGSTLSATMRQAWESVTLSTLTKISALHATGVHISVLAHITPGELRKKLRTVELTNGFANRFLFVASRKSKHLPDGGRVADGALERIAAELRQVVDCAKAEQRLEMTPQASAQWHEVYRGELNDVRASELLEAATSRAAPQVLRLSCIYAVLDHADAIDLTHLNAGLAVWRYCFDSAAYMLGLATGNPTADTILAALEGAPDGLDRTDLSAVFGNNKPASEISTALAYLQDRGRIERLSVQLVQGKPGRPPERWHCTKETKKTKKPPDRMPVAGVNSFLSFNSSAPLTPALVITQLVDHLADTPAGRIAALSPGDTASRLTSDADAALDRALAGEWQRALAKTRGRP